MILSRQRQNWLFVCHLVPVIWVLGVLIGMAGCKSGVLGLSPSKTSDLDANAELALSADEIAAENTLLESWGLHWSGANFLLQHPFSDPLSNKSFIVPSSWYQLKLKSPDEQIDSLALRRDLPILERAIDKIYGGYQNAENLGFDFRAWIQEWDMSLASGPEQLSVKDALMPYKKLMAVQLDNHSGPQVRYDFGSGSASAILAAEPHEKCELMKNVAGETYAINDKDPAQRVKQAKSPGAGTVNYLSFPAMRGQMAAIKCGGDWIALKMVWFDAQSQRTKIQDLAQANPEEPSYRRLSPQLEYLRLPTFSVGNVEKMATLAQRLPSDAASGSTLIVDMRMNGGGNGMGAASLLKPWVDLEARLQEIGMNRRSKVSCLTKATEWGYTQVSMMGMQAPLSADLQANLQRQLDELEEASDSGCPVSYEELKANWNYKDHRYVPAGVGAKKILVITDSGCGSDCEFVTYLLASLPHTLIVGANTYGVMQFTQPHYFVLPNTRIPFRLARGIGDSYGDLRSVDGYGLDVDLVLSTEEQYSAEKLIELAERME